MKAERNDIDQSEGRLLRERHDVFLERDGFIGVGVMSEPLRTGTPGNSVYQRQCCQ
jgi:hypothetical protein